MGLHIPLKSRGHISNSKFNLKRDLGATVFLSIEATCFIIYIKTYIHKLHFFISALFLKLGIVFCNEMVTMFP